MKKVTIDGNSACANIAYLMNDMAIIYPITPSSTISELCDSFSANKEKNIFNNVGKVVQMQSEAGVAGCLHGALSAGSLATTFTSSQGLLLMIPNMYKIAGELLPSVFYVASRSLATHALNIFCDHSDIYACLKTGFNIISCSSVQEVNDMAIVCQLSTLKSQLPFICFFDGFRTSHELSTIEQSTLEDIKTIVDFEDIKNFKKTALSNFEPFAKGTNQNPDVFFQNRMASLGNYNNVLNTIKQNFSKLKIITNRSYETIEYYGDPNARNVIVSMGSATDVLKLVTKDVKSSGVIKIRVLKPFDEKEFIKKLPKNVQTITVLERNLDPNGVDSLRSFVVDSLYKAKKTCKLFSGVYGLGGKDFTPDMAYACFENMTTTKKDFFTIGINDDKTHTSLEIKSIYKENNDNYCARIYGFGSDGSVSSAKNIIKILGEKHNTYAQGYFDYDSKKSGSLTISHIRTQSSSENMPFNSQHVNISLCNNPSFISKYDMTSCIKKDGIFLINCNYSAEELNKIIPNQTKKDILKKNLSVYTIDANDIALKYNLGGKINTIMQTALFYLNKSYPFKTSLKKIKESIITSYSKKGDEIVTANINAIDDVPNNIKKIDCSYFTLQDKIKCEKTNNEYFEEIIKPINSQQGNDLPVSKFAPNGQMPTNTSKLEKRGIASQIPEWIPENCIQCGRCAMSCPHACLVAVEFNQKDASLDTFKSAKAFSSDNRYRMQLSPLDCTGCGVCSEVCPVKQKALKMNSDLEFRQQEIKNYEIFKNLKTCNPVKEFNCKGLQYSPSYFEFSGACAGCGETPYIKLVSQLFGDRMLIANATGCSSIYSGTYPTCPYSKDKNGFGPAWANSLFEDNAEFGYGIALANKLEREHFINKLKTNKNKYSKFVKEMVELFLNDTDNDEQNKEIINKLNFYKNTKIIESKDTEVFDNMKLFIKPSYWIIGGDGWAYDIGFGGLDQVIASQENVNILILDSEVYSNTGGQTSKSTPRGASAKFNVSGKTTPKKNILEMFMTYKNVYCAQVSLGANPDQCVKAFVEAEKFNGPSIILAYSPCINHGYDMKNSQTHELNAVKSGYTSLFRYNPNNELNITIDSFEPTMNPQEYLMSENRYKILNKTNPENKEILLELNEKDAIARREAIKNRKN